MEYGLPLLGAQVAMEGMKKRRGRGRKRARKREMRRMDVAELKFRRPNPTLPSSGQLQTPRSTEYIEVEQTRG